MHGFAEFRLWKSSWSVSTTTHCKINSQFVNNTLIIQWNFSKPDPPKTGSPWISANFFSPCRTILCKRSLTKPATPLNWPYFLVPVLAGFGIFHWFSFEVLDLKIIIVSRICSNFCLLLHEYIHKVKNN
jgi:hypothetical protein